MSDEEFTEAVTRYTDAVFCVCLSFCRNRSDAEDIVQNVFLKMYAHENPFQDGEHVKRWLLRVAVNECKTHLTSPWYKRVTLTEDNAALERADTQAEEVFGDSEHSELLTAVRSLPPKYRAVVHLYYYEDYSVAAIADMLGLKETTVQTQLMRARQKLKKMLTEADYEF